MLGFGGTCYNLFVWPRDLGPRFASKLQNQTGSRPKSYQFFLSSYATQLEINTLPFYAISLLPFICKYWIFHVLLS